MNQKLIIGLLAAIVILLGGIFFVQFSEKQEKTAVSNELDRISIEEGRQVQEEQRIMRGGNYRAFGWMFHKRGEA